MGESQMILNLQELLQPNHELADLSTLPTTDEMNEIIKNMQSDRAPGPDGFNGLFLKKCWHIISADYYELASQFFGGVSIQNLNNSFITLIPKRPNPEGRFQTNCFAEFIPKVHHQDYGQQVAICHFEHSSPKPVWLHWGQDNSRLPFLELWIFIPMPSKQKRNNNPQDWFWIGFRSSGAWCNLTSSTSQGLQWNQSKLD